MMEKKCQQVARQVARCPNCQSEKYRQTTSMDHCLECNYKVEYWGNMAMKNDVADEYFVRQYYMEKFREQFREHGLINELRDNDYD